MQADRQTESKELQADLSAEVEIGLWSNQETKPPGLHFKYNNRNVSWNTYDVYLKI